MRALFQILRHGVVIGASERAAEIAVPGVEQLAVFRNENVNVEAFPVDMLVASIEMPAAFRRLVLIKVPSGKTDLTSSPWRTTRRECGYLALTGSRNFTGK
jgi:hypothetical protein